MGLVNTVVPLDKLEEETLVWCREMVRNRLALLTGGGGRADVECI